MEIRRKFSCCCCGACCRSLYMIPDLENTELSGFCGPDGVCIYLDKNTNLCTIYEDRPLLCRVDDQYDLLFRDKMTRSEYYKLQHEICKILDDNINGSGSV